jgi:hypothetical protein
MKKNQVRPRAQTGAAGHSSPGIAVKTLQEPKIGPLEPFEIAGVFQYL